MGTRLLVGGPKDRQTADFSSQGVSVCGELSEESSKKLAEYAFLVCSAKCLFVFNDSVYIEGIELSGQYYYVNDKEVEFELRCLVAKQT